MRLAKGFGLVLALVLLPVSAAAQATSSAGQFRKRRSGISSSPGRFARLGVLSSSFSNQPSHHVRRGGSALADSVILHSKAHAAVAAVGHYCVRLTSSTNADIGPGRP